MQEISVVSLEILYVLLQGCDKNSDVVLGQPWHWSLQCFIFLLLSVGCHTRWPISHQIPEDECAISLDGDGFKEGDVEDLTNVEAGTNNEVEEEEDTDKNEKPEKPEVPERRDLSERKDEKRSSTATDDFADEELDSEVEDTGGN